MRIDINDPQAWNKWRELYWQLTDEENQAFANAIEEKYPDQNHANYTLTDSILSQIQPMFKVLEIGGWKGNLAKHAFEKFGISKWVNIEYCENAAKKQECKNPNYHVIHKPEFRWFYQPRTEEFDLAIAMHVIEHFANQDLIEFLKHLNGIPNILFEAPIEDGKNNWDNYGGTHILEMGWTEITQIMESYGYTCRHLNGHCKFYSKS